MAVIRIPIETMLIPERTPGTPGVGIATTWGPATDHIRTGDYLTRVVADDGTATITRWRSGDEMWDYIAVADAKPGERVRVMAHLHDPYVFPEDAS